MSSSTERNIAGTTNPSPSRKQQKQKQRATNDGNRSTSTASSLFDFNETIEKGKRTRATADDIQEKSLLRERDQLDQEIEEGNVEYKSMLINLSEERFQRLMSQMKWRMTEGDGEALYEIGVDDNGVPLGLNAQEYEESLQNVERLAKELEADMTILCEKPVNGSGKKVAEVLLRRYSTDQYLDMRIAVCGNVDSGKCLARDTLVMLYSGEVVPVQNVKIGDCLMGDDSSPRRVLITSEGRGQLYHVKSQDGEKTHYTVNQNHVLSLIDEGTGSPIDLPINQFLDLDVQERNARYRGYKTSVESFGTETKAKLIVDPYVAGRMIGILAHVQPSNRLRNDENMIYEMRHIFNKEKRRTATTNDDDGIYENLMALVYGNNGKIPPQFKYGTRTTRTALVAGIIDSDIGTSHHASKAEEDMPPQDQDLKIPMARIAEHKRQLAVDITFVIRSLGFMASLNEHKNAGYLECAIDAHGAQNLIKMLSSVRSGETCDSLPKTTIFDSAPITVEDAGMGEYFGFQLDGNHRFLLGDFTVTHNSTLIGVLTKGQLDNGRGRARTSVFQHRHEVETGRTSSVSHHIVGFDSKGKIVNYDSVATHMDWKDIVCKSSKIVTFIDLCGHEKYYKTTVTGMTGHAVDYACVVVGANMGVLKMTKEHIGLCLALKIPMFFIVTKVDICPEHVLKETLATIHKLLKLPGVRKLPYHIKNEDDVLTCAKNITSDRIVPIFLTSSVTGDKLELVRQFLNLLPARKDWESKVDEPTQFVIDATFFVTGIGTVVSGTVEEGTISVGDMLSLGPDGNGQFRQVQIKSIHAKRVNVKRALAGQQVSCALKKIPRSSIRKGMVLVDNSVAKAVFEFTAEILVLSHSTLIKCNYQPVVHTGCCRQSCKIIAMDKDNLKTGEKTEATFRFMFRPEFIKVGERLIFREGRTKGLGVITSLRE